MPALITGTGWYEEHGDCSKLKRQIHVKKQGLKYVAEAFTGWDFKPINKGRIFKSRLLKDIRKYVKKHKEFYNNQEQIVFYEIKQK